jgi:transposase
MDNLPAHKSKVAENTVKARGAWVLFLPPYSLDFNPIAMACTKLKAHLRASAARTIDTLWRRSGASAISSLLQNAKLLRRRRGLSSPAHCGKASKM